MSCEIVTSQRFRNQAKKLKKKYISLNNDLLLLYDELFQNPKCGTALGNGFYKVRLTIKSKNKGKSGGARVITFLFSNQNNILILSSIYDKSDIENISDKAIVDILEEIKIEHPNYFK